MRKQFDLLLERNGFAYYPREGNQVAQKAGHLLVVHGAQDVRVSLGQAEAVVSSLRARGAEVEFLVNPDEGHWFINEESNHQLYRTIESFLSRHIRDRASG